MHPLLKFQNTSAVFDYSSDLGIRSCIGSMDSSFLQIGKAIPVYRATYYCGQKCTWPPENEWKAMKEEDAKKKKQAKFERGRSTKVKFLPAVTWKYSHFKCNYLRPQIIQGK